MSFPERVNVLGVGVSVIDRMDAVEVIECWIEDGASNYVCVTGVHGVIESQFDERLREIHNHAGLVTPDGMPLVWMSRLWGKGKVDRVYGPDLLIDICRKSEQQNWRHFFYGGTEEILEKLKYRLTMKFPGLDIVGALSPPFREFTQGDSEQFIRHVVASGADIVWIGLSTPKQERWMAEHVAKLPATVLIGVGAAFDFHAGHKRQAPRWMQRSGTEWLFRLATEPRRLWRRYLFNNPLFIYLIAQQAMGFKRYRLE